MREADNAAVGDLTAISVLARAIQLVRLRLVFPSVCTPGIVNHHATLALATSRAVRRRLVLLVLGY